MPLPDEKLRQLQEIAMLLELQERMDQDERLLPDEMKHLLEGQEHLTSFSTQFQNENRKPLTLDNLQQVYPQLKQVEQQVRAPDSDNAQRIITHYQEQYAEEPFYKEPIQTGNEIKLNFASEEQMNAFYQELADFGIDFDSYDSKGTLLCAARSGNIYNSMAELTSAGHETIPHMEMSFEKVAEEDMGSGPSMG
jgi:arginyl-tRNA synthetase